MQKVYHGAACHVKLGDQRKPGLLWCGVCLVCYCAYGIRRDIQDEDLLRALQLQHFYQVRFFCKGTSSMRAALESYGCQLTSLAQPYLL